MTEKWKFAVTFESATQQPETVRGEVAGTVSAAAARAMRSAKKQKPTKSRYESLSMLLQRDREAKTDG